MYFFRTFVGLQELRDIYRPQRVQIAITERRQNVLLQNVDVLRDSRCLYPLGHLALEPLQHVGPKGRPGRLSFIGGLGLELLLQAFSQLARVFERSLAYPLCFHFEDARAGRVTCEGCGARKAGQEVAYRRRWLGVEWPGSTLPVDAEDPARGQLARDAFRFTLWRRISDGEGLVCWIMLNPSTASHDMDDATLRRMTRYSRDWGYGWLTVGNLWPYRATNPEDLRRWIEDGHHRVGHALDDNDRRVCTMARRADLVVAAWGAPGNGDSQARDVRAQLAAAGIELHALAMTSGGEPSHPLRLPATLRPTPIAALAAQRAA